MTQYALRSEVEILKARVAALESKQKPEKPKEENGRNTKLKDE